MDLESTRTRITSLVVSVHQTLLTPLASRFLTPPTRPEHLKRPESGRPWGVKNSRTVQSGSSVQSCTLGSRDGKTPFTQFIAHDQFSACNPHKPSIV